MVKPAIMSEPSQDRWYWGNHRTIGTQRLMAFPLGASVVTGT
jgi:hypothetical protein